MRKQYHAKHILLEEEDDVEYVLEQLDSGTPFEELAQEFSSCDSAAKGGDLGKFNSGVMVPEFERALYHMKPGEIKAPVRTKFGLHIILRVE
jgi:peptidyl-prolyl cis-trans isomerase C